MTPFQESIRPGACSVALRLYVRLTRTNGGTITDDGHDPHQTIGLQIYVKL